MTNSQSLKMSTWLQVLVSVLGAFEVLMAVSAASATTIVVGVVGGVALIAFPWVPSVRLRLVLLLIGTLPFAILTWWSVGGPLVAVVALAIGIPTLRHVRADSPSVAPESAVDAPR